MSGVSKIPDDERFVIHVSDSMEIRNALRSGLINAQEKDQEKIPLFMSWPEWLEDGIVSLYAKDFRDILLNAVREAGSSMIDIIEKEKKNR